MFTPLLAAQEEVLILFRKGRVGTQLNIFHRVHAAFKDGLVMRDVLHAQAPSLTSSATCGTAWRMTTGDSWAWGCPCGSSSSSLSFSAPSGVRPHPHASGVRPDVHRKGLMSEG